MGKKAYSAVVSLYDQYLQVLPFESKHAVGANDCLLSAGNLPSTDDSVGPIYQ